MNPRDDPLSRAKATHLFERGPFSSMLARLPGGRSPQHGLERQAIGVALIAWAPLVVASLAQDGFRFGASITAMLTDFGAHARYLAALPLLVMADGICGNRLTAVARNFVDCGMVREAERPKFDALVSSTRRRCESGWAAVVIVACTYALLTILVGVIPQGEIPSWHRLGESRVLSAAGWWHVLVSAALLLALLIGWLWRLLVWTHFLWRMARLPIRLCAAHPDRAGGLKFVGYSVRAFAPIGAALGTVLAGRIANRVWLTDEKLSSYEMVVAGLVGGVMLLFGAPLLAFTLRLLREWREGVASYGRLAGQLGFQFEDKWFYQGQRVDPGVLDASDFSAAVDLSGYAANVYDLRLAPGDLKSFIVLAVGTILPLLPVVLIAAPFEVLLKEIGAVLF
jgi:hypothetical protein